MQCTIFKVFPTFKLYLSLNEHILHLLKYSLKSSHNLSVIDSSQTWLWSLPKYYKRYIFKINNKAVLYLSDLSHSFIVSFQMCSIHIPACIFLCICAFHKIVIQCTDYSVPLFPFNSISSYTFNTISWPIFYSVLTDMLYLIMVSQCPITWMNNKLINFLLINIQFVLNYFAIENNDTINTLVFIWTSVCEE